MAWLLRDFALLSVLLRAATLAIQSVLLGGLVYVVLVGWAAGPSAQPALELCRRGIRLAALALLIAQLLYVAVDTAILMETIQVSLREVVTADYFLAGLGAAIASIGLFFAMHGSGTPLHSRMQLLLTSLPFIIVLLASSVWKTHSVSRLDHRLITGLLTGLHQFAVAAWIGALPYLLVSLRVVEEPACARFIARRFSKMAVTSVALMIASGLGLSYFYIGSWEALYGTAYGVMVVTKCALLALVLLLGMINYWLVRIPNFRSNSVILPATALELKRLQRPLNVLRRISEAEIGIGFTIILAAASLTSQAPAVDLVQDRLTANEVLQRVRPAVPRFSYPAEALSPATPLEGGIHSFDSSENARAHRKDPDIADSEASHHWAGLILLVISAGAWLSRSSRFPWARYWPLGFVGLAAFLFIRVDPENWPLGPNSYWKSFHTPEVLEHRIIIVLLVCYAVFETGVQIGRLKSRVAASVFPLLMAVSGAVLLLHSHALGNVKEELLIEMTHNSIAVFAVLAGWARWLEVRLPEAQGGRIVPLAGLVWPVCLVLVACLLLNYREA